MDGVCPILSQDASTDFDSECLRSLQPVTYHHHGQAQGEVGQVQYLVHHLLGAYNHTCRIFLPQVYEQWIWDIYAEEAGSKEEL